MRLNNAGNPPQCWCVKPVIPRQPDLRLKPELRFRPALSNMNVRRLERIAFIRIEEEAQSIETKDNRHHYSPNSICSGNTPGPSGSRRGRPRGRASRR